MISFKQYITEVFDKPYKWSGGNVAKGSITPENQGIPEEYRFKTSDGGTVEFIANYFWKAASQRLKTKEGIMVALEFVKNNKYDMTGEGDALRILATVLDIIKSVVKKHEPTTIIFSADKGQDNRKTRTKEPTGRVGAYAAIVKRFAGKMGYKSTTNDDNKKVGWTLTKK
jgi:hypothetical protein